MPVEMVKIWSAFKKQNNFERKGGETQVQDMDGGYFILAGN